MYGIRMEELVNKNDNVIVIYSISQGSFDSWLEKKLLIM